MPNVEIIFPGGKNVIVVIKIFVVDDKIPSSYLVKRKELHLDLNIKDFI